MSGTSRCTCVSHTASGRDWTNLDCPRHGGVSGTMVFKPSGDVMCESPLEEPKPMTIDTIRADLARTLDAAEMRLVDALCATFVMREALGRPSGGPQEKPE